jgi:N-acetylglutamate synthase-like GNAT family acetyltransferase
MPKVSRPAITISDLRQQPGFFDAVADRVWRAWWEPRGHPLAYIAGRLQENMNETPIPFALVAHAGTTFAGTASVIVSDMEERPHYSPWVAAVWVDPEYRGRGIGAALVEQAAQACFLLRVERVYLCALPARRDFYSRRGWTLIEEDVGESQLSVLSRES